MNSRLTPITERWLRALLLVREKRIIELEAELAEIKRKALQGLSIIDEAPVLGRGGKLSE